MLRYKKRSKAIMRGIFASLGVSAFSISFIPLVELIDGQTSQIFSYAIGTLFWLGLISGLILTKWIRSVHARPRNYFRMHEMLDRHRRPGIISFGFTPMKLAIYAVFIVCLTLTVVDFTTHFMSEYIAFPIISVMIFSFEIHCIVDGENFEIYKMLVKGRYQK